jgi:MoaA/NifB/PqqE/SkfB family radical SAM enzyme
VKAVIIIGGGEPLMHKSIGIVLNTLANAGIHIGIVTNGTLIHRYLEEIANCVSWIRVSMDAATPETHAIFRPSNRASHVFPSIVANMRELAKRKQGKLGYSFLLMYRTDRAGNVVASNYGELFAAGELAKDIGCDYFEVKAVFDEGHFILHTPDELLRSAREQFEALQLLENDNFRILKSSTFTAMIERRNTVQPKSYEKCLAIELRTTITPTGVYVCPSHRGNPLSKIGDMAEQSFEEMWQNADTGVVNPKTQCSFHCPRHDTNMEIAQLAGTHITQHSLVDDFDFFI